MTANEVSGPAGDRTAQGATTSDQQQFSATSPDQQDYFDRIPRDLREWCSWVVWRYEHVQNQAKLTKVPYNALTSRKASSADPNTWCDFDTCAAAVRAKVGWNGIGFVLSERDPYCFIDFDLPKDEHGNRLDRPDILARHEAQIRALNSYTEWSPGGGVHVVVRGRVSAGRKRDFVEVYSSGRFMTMTGNVWMPQ